MFKLKALKLILSKLTENNNKGIDRSFKGRTTELFKISIPIVIEQLFTTMLGAVNTMMAATLGMYALSAVSMIDSITNIIIAIYAALTVGCTIVVAQYIGRGEKSQATTAAAQSALLSVFFSLVLFIFFFFFQDYVVSSILKEAEVSVLEAARTYLGITIYSFFAIALTQTIFGILRGTGDTGSPMLITIIMNLFNIAIGYIVIIGLNINFFGLFKIVTPSFGIAGAGIALLASRYIGVALSLFFIIKRSKIIKLNKPVYFKPVFSMQKTILGIGIPTSIESSLFQVGRLITQLFIVSMGTAAMAANSIGGTYFAIISVPGNAFCTGVMILVGHRIGRGEKDDVEKTVMFSLKFGMLLMFILCFASFPFTDFISATYRADAPTAALLKQLLYSAFIATPLFWPLAFIIPSALRATGDVKFTMLVSVIAMWIFRIGSGYLFGVILGLGVLGVWFGMYIDWAIRGVVFIIRLKHGHWKTKDVL